MNALLTRARLSRLAGFVSAQAGVQALGFACGIVLVRHMAPAQYGLYTLAAAMVGVANVLTELGVTTAVLAIGGRLAGHAAGLAGLVADARTLHRLLCAGALCVVLPVFSWLLVRQQVSFVQVAALSAMGGATAFLNVRSGIALSVARLAGHLGLQQRVDLGSNAMRLVLLLAVAAVSLDAATATFLNLVVAGGAAIVWSRYLAREFAGLPAPRGEHVPALRHFVARQAPNSIYYVLSSQLAVWLVAVFGNAERVADVGALGRLGAGFALVVAVTGAMVQPYFARNHRPADLDAGFAALNAFFVGLVAGLVAVSVLWPEPLLWILGAHYAGLQRELPWMVLATGLASWSGTLYMIGCGRGWVLPGSLGIVAGIVATLAGLRCFDVSTVSGNFKLAALGAGVAVLLNFAYLVVQLAHHRRGPLPVLQGAAKP